MSKFCGQKNYILFLIYERQPNQVQPQFFGDSNLLHHYLPRMGKAMLQNTFVTTKYSTPSQVVTLVMPFPKLSLSLCSSFPSGVGKF